MHNTVGSISQYFQWIRSLGDLKGTKFKWDRFVRHIMLIFRSLTSSKMVKLQEKESMTMLCLLSDQAIGEGKVKRSDGLGFNTYSQFLTEAIKDTYGPFTIGIFGEWGTGKSSLMRLIEGELKGCPGIIPIWVNAWRFEKEEHPIVPLAGC